MFQLLLPKKSLYSELLWSAFFPHFPAFGLNMERYGVSFRIWENAGKMRTRITPNTDTFYAVYVSNFIFIQPSSLGCFAICNTWGMLNLCQYILWYLGRQECLEEQKIHIYYLSTNRRHSWILYLVLYLRQICYCVTLALLFFYVPNFYEKVSKFSITPASVRNVIFFFWVISKHKLWILFFFSSVISRVIWTRLMTKPRNPRKNSFCRMYSES